jgi:LPXTG-motif cell wall-anchored protein
VPVVDTAADTGTDSAGAPEPGGDAAAAATDGGGESGMNSPGEPTPGEETPGAPAADEVAPAPTDEAVASDQPPAPETENAAPVAVVAAAPAAPATHDPRASIGNVACPGRTVAVTLDNTRSTDATTFAVMARDDFQEQPTYDHTFTVAAGERLVVVVPLVEDVPQDVEVSDTRAGDTGTELPLAAALLTANCSPNGGPRDPRASIGNVDCEILTVPVMLDNTRSTTSMTFQVFGQSSAVGGSTYDKDFTVAAGETLVVDVPVTEDTRVVVGASDRELTDSSGGEDGILAAELLDVDCAPGRPRVQPRALFSAVDCSHLTVSLTLDNSGSDVAAEFFVSSGETEELPPLVDRTTDLAPGATEVLSLPVRRESAVEVLATTNVLLEPTELASLQVGCPAPAARPLPRLTQLPQTGGVNLMLPLVGLGLLGSGVTLVALGRRRDS